MSQSDTVLQLEVHCLSQRELNTRGARLNRTQVGGYFINDVELRATHDGEAEGRISGKLICAQVTHPMYWERCLHGSRLKCTHEDLISIVHSEMQICSTNGSSQSHASAAH